MHREQHTIGFFSQFGKTLETFYNWIIFEYPEQKNYHFQYQNNHPKLHKPNTHIQSYLNTYTKNILNKKIAYYASSDYIVYKCLKEYNK
jgi:hypothetical protein